MKILQLKKRRINHGLKRFNHKIRKQIAAEKDKKNCTDGHKYSAHMLFLFGSKPEQDKAHNNEHNHYGHGKKEVGDDLF